MGFSREGQPLPLKDSNLSTCDRLPAHRRNIFLRDWILVLIALGLAVAAGTFRSDRSPSPHGRLDPAAFVR